jgi:uncharacterized Zn-finger protein
MKAVEIINTKSTSVVCNGKEAPYDHPKVYLEIDLEVGSVVCPYCSNKFTLTK